MMRASERTCSHKRCIVTKFACDGMNLGGLKRFVECKRWKNCWQTFREHSFARTRRTNHNNVMSTSSCNLHGAFDVFLALHVTEISVVEIHFAGKHFRNVERNGFDGFRSFEKSNGVHK